MITEQDAPVRLDPTQRTLVQKNLGLVADYLRRNTRIPPQPMSRCEYDDLFQEGTLGLMRAAARFDPKQDKTFVAFALKHIHGAVSRALAERFSTVHVPAKRIKEASKRRRAEAIEQAKGNLHPIPRGGATPLCSTSNLGDDDVRLCDKRACETVERRRLGDVVRDRYEHAVWAAADRVRRRRRGRADRGHLIDRLVRDRLLIPEEGERTPLRQIAREMRCTAGRALICERQIAGLAATILRTDPVYVRVRELACADAESLRLEVDRGIERDLASREERHFGLRMRQLEDEEQRTILLRLVSETCGSGRVLASLLFRTLGRSQRARILMEVAEESDPSAAA